MQFTTVVLAFFATIAAAAPSYPAASEPLCSSSIDTASCCEVNVDGILGLTCASPSGSPKTLKSFIKSCASEGKGAACCTLVTDATGVVCNPVVA